jgi:hypothetical protein
MRRFGGETETRGIKEEEERDRGIRKEWRRVEGKEGMNRVGEVGRRGGVEEGKGVGEEVKRGEG